VSLASYPACTQRLHVHERASISILVSGQGVDRSRRQNYDQPPLTAVFHPTSEPHANDIGPRGVVGLTLEMPSAWLEAYGLTERALGGYRVIARDVHSRLACLSLLAATARDGCGAANDLETHALELLELLVLPNVGPEGGPPPPWLSRGEEFLRTHFRSSIGLSRVAREAGVHPIHFARVFRGRHGWPVSAYLQSLRLTAAGELIVAGDQPLARIASGTGFADQPHMTRCFSRVVGLSPGAFRWLLHPARTASPGVKRNRSAAVGPMQIPRRNRA
jgi:AraC family transcriptional regulator